MVRAKTEIRSSSLYIEVVRMNLRPHICYGSFDFDRRTNHNHTIHREYKPDS